MSEREEVKYQTSQTNTAQFKHYPVIAETENIIFITDLEKEKGGLEVSIIVDILKVLQEKLKQMDINVDINIMDYFFDKFFNRINKKIIIITDHLQQEFENYKFRKLLEDRIKELKDEILKEIPRHVGSRLYYAKNGNEAILVHYYLQFDLPFEEIEKILKAIPTHLMLTPESDIKEKEYIYKGQYSYITLFKSKNSSENNYELLDIGNAVYNRCAYDDLNKEFRILELKNIIITEVTPYAAVLFIKDLDRTVFGDYTFNNGTE